MHEIFSNLRVRIKTGLARKVWMVFRRKYSVDHITEIIDPKVSVLFCYLIVMNERRVINLHLKITLGNPLSVQILDLA